MPASRPLALLFDLDGTLADSIELLLASFRHAFETVRVAPPSDAQWIAGIGTPLVAQMRSHVLDEGLVEQLITAYRAHQREHHDRLLREFAGTRETLALLEVRGHPMAVVTSKSTELAHRALQRLGLGAFIDVVIGVDSCARHKPDPEPVHLALRTLGYDAGKALFVGDSPHDIAAGNAAGVTTVGALWGPFTRTQLEAARPDFLIQDIRDVVRIVEQVASNLSPRSTI